MPLDKCASHHAQKRNGAIGIGEHAINSMCDWLPGAVSQERLPDCQHAASVTPYRAAARDPRAVRQPFVGLFATKLACLPAYPRVTG
jgi:hypothetical protein